MGPLAIRLTELEEKLCTFIEGFTQQLQKENQNVQCYIAGGWVRDKLLGLESNDIDIALSTMMGVPFAEKFAKYLEKYGVRPSRVTKVESRVEQSKHLETAKMDVLGLDLDFVNLRSEEYAAQSRIPTKVKFGTPLEDTLRRDITINALLYNIHSRSVEDHTGKGLDDLRNGIIRTPLPPRQTFLDDPLRVLRCVRFASRYGYELVPELADAARDREIQTALEMKIARERIGDEIDKMMKGADPLRAIKLIDFLNLQRSIFSPPTSNSLSVSVPDNVSHHAALAAATILHQFVDFASDSTRGSVAEFSESNTSPHGHTSSQLLAPHPTLLNIVLQDTSTKRRLFLASALTPYKDLFYQEKKKNKLVVEACIREGLKLGVQNHYLDGIPALFTASKLLWQPRLDKFETPSQRVALGLLLRNKCVHNPNKGTYWTSSLLFSLVQELVLLWDPAGDRLNMDAANEVVSLYTTFVNRIEELNLPSVLEAPPILDGREVSSLLCKKPGPWMGRVLDEIIEWQLEHAEGTREECSIWLESQVKAGGIVLEEERISGRSEGTSRLKRAKFI